MQELEFLIKHAWYGLCVEISVIFTDLVREPVCKSNNDFVYFTIYDPSTNVWRQ